jgi:hypothetical protein
MAKHKFILNVPEDIMDRLRRMSYFERESMTFLVLEAVQVSLEMHEDTFLERHGYEIPPLGRPEVARKTA